MTNDSDLILLPLLIIDTDSDKIKSSFLISTFAASPSIYSYPSKKLILIGFQLHKIHL